MRDRIKFTATVEHPEKGQVVLQIDVPVGQCNDHFMNDVDEDTPEPPHVHSTSGYHNDYEVCFGALPGESS